MRKTWTYRLGVTAVLLSGLVVAACTSASPTPGGSTSGAATKAAPELTVVVGHAAEEVTLDPNVSTTGSWLSVIYNMYDTVVGRNRDGSLGPGLAESWQTIDPTTWEFKLRKDVKFHNGEAFDANDVKFTIDRILDPATKLPQNTFLGSVKEVQVVDPYTVRVITKTPDPFMAEYLTIVPIASAKFVQAKGAAELTNGENGSGPYRLVEWIKGDRLTIEAVSDHWRGPAKVKKAVFRVIPEPSALVAALQVGEVDVAINVLPDSAKALANATNFSIKAVPGNRNIFIDFHNTVKPLDDRRVRQALNYGVDKQELVNGVLLGYADVVPTLTGPLYFGYDDTLKPYPYDPAKAQQLLADAGYPGGLDITLNAPVGRYTKDKEVAEAITGQLAKVGVRVNLKTQEWGAYSTAYRNQELSPMFLIGFGQPILDFSQPLRSHMADRAVFRDAELQSMSAQALSTVDREQRRQLLVTIQRRIYEEAAFLFLYAQQDIYGVSNRIDWTPRPDERVWLYEFAPR